jgi:hypothetical protein
MSHMDTEYKPTFSFHIYENKLGAYYVNYTLTSRHIDDGTYSQ